VKACTGGGIGSLSRGAALNLGAKVDEQGLEGFALELSWEIGSEAI